MKRKRKIESCVSPSHDVVDLGTEFSQNDDDIVDLSKPQTLKPVETETLTSSQEIKQTSDMDESLSCTLCSVRYDETKHLPKALTCLHTFCLACLDLLVKHKDSLPCPTCSTITIPPKQDVNSLTTNFALLEVALAFAGVESQKCQLCDGENCNATRRCETCEQAMCTRQALLHSQTENHTTVLIKRRLRKVMCDKHSAKEIELYCLEHDLFLCVLCVLSHRQCSSLEAISDVYEREYSNVKDVIEKGQHNKKLLEISIQNIKESKEKHQQNIATLEQEVERYFDQIERSLKSRKSQLIDQIRQAFHPKTQLLSDQYSKMELEFTELIASMEQMENLLKQEESQRHVFLRTKGHLKSHVDIKELDVDEGLNPSCKFIPDLSFVDVIAKTGTIMISDLKGSSSRQSDKISVQDTLHAVQQQQAVFQQLQYQPQPIQVHHQQIPQIPEQPQFQFQPFQHQAQSQQAQLQAHQFQAQLQAQQAQQQQAQQAQQQQAQLQAQFQLQQQAQQQVHLQQQAPRLQTQVHAPIAPPSPPPPPQTDQDRMQRQLLAQRALQQLHLLQQANPQLQHLTPQQLQQQLQYHYQLQVQQHQHQEAQRQHQLLLQPIPPPVVRPPADLGGSATPFTTTTTDESDDEDAFGEDD